MGEPIVSVAGSSFTSSSPSAEGLESEAAVHLKSGAFYRGVILEYVPGSHVIIRSATGEPRRLEADQIDSLVMGGKAEKVERQGVEAAVSGTELDRILKEIPGPRIRLSITGNRSSSLQRRIGPDFGYDQSAYILVCGLPCEVALPAEDSQPYRIGGTLLEPTPWFPLPKTDAAIEGELISRVRNIIVPAFIVGSVMTGAVGGGLLALHHGADVGGDGLRNSGFVLSGLSGAFFMTAGILSFTEPQSVVTIDGRPFKQAGTPRDPAESRDDRVEYSINVGSAGAFGGDREGAHFEVISKMEVSYGWGPRQSLYTGPYVRGSYFHDDESGERNGSLAGGMGFGLWTLNVRKNFRTGIGGLLGYDHESGSFYEALGRDRIEMGGRIFSRILDFGLGTELLFSTSVDPTDTSASKIYRVGYLFGIHF